MLMVNYTLRKQMMIINGELESIDRMMSPHHHGDIFIPDICHERHEYIRVNFFWPV